MLEFILKPWHVIVLSLASHLNREQQCIIEYIQMENQVLREKLGKKRILLNDAQRRRLAVKGKALGSRAVSCTILSGFVPLLLPPQYRSAAQGASARKETKPCKARQRHDSTCRINEQVVGTDDRCFGRSSIVGYRVDARIIHGDGVCFVSVGIGVNRR